MMNLSKITGDQLNAFSQNIQLNGFSTVWLHLCLVKVIDWLNTFSQNIHLNSLSPVWLSLCAVKWPDWLNTSSQNKHLKGFARILLSLCVVKWADRINNFSQIDIHLAWIIHAGSNLLSLQIDILMMDSLTLYNIS